MGEWLEAGDPAATSRATHEHGLSCIAGALGQKSRLVFSKDSWRLILCPASDRRTARSWLLCRSVQSVCTVYHMVNCLPGDTLVMRYVHSLAVPGSSRDGTRLGGWTQSKCRRR